MLSVNHYSCATDHSNEIFHLKHSNNPNVSVWCVCRWQYSWIMWERQSPHKQGQQASLCCVPEPTAAQPVEEQKEQLTSHTGTNTYKLSPAPSLSHLNHFMVYFFNGLNHKRVNVCRYLWVQRGPLSVAVYKDAKRAKGSGRGCGSSSKTRCSTPLKHERWGDPESPTPAQTLDYVHTKTHIRTCTYHNNYFLKQLHFRLDFCERVSTPGTRELWGGSEPGSKWSPG